MSERIIRVGTIVPEIKLANPDFNSTEIIKQLKKASEQDIEIVALPALSITGVSCGDLFLQDILIEKNMSALKKIIDSTGELKLIAIIGTYIKFEDDLYNIAVVIKEGKILGIVPKIKLSYQEKRFFKCGKHLLNKKVNLFDEEIIISNDSFKIDDYEGISFGVSLDGIFNDESNILFHISSDNELVGMTDKLLLKAKTVSINNKFAYVYCSPGINESTSDLVYSGYSFICNEGKVIVDNEKYSFESTLISGDISFINEEKTKEPIMTNNNVLDSVYNSSYLKEKQILKERIKFPFVPEGKDALEKRCEEVIKLQAAALLRRLKQLGSYKTVIGLSGGSDSTLAFLVIIEAYKMVGVDNSNMIAITMPGFGTTGRTYTNSINLAKKYNVTLKEINIKDACTQHFKDIEIDENDRSITFENAQARERTQILMDIANKENALVVGTGDMSELALGWCTYNGDHMSMYAVNAGVPKTLIKHIINYKAYIEDDDTLRDIADTPISPELLPPDENDNIVQKTESSIGPYELHDYFLYHFLRYKTAPNRLLEISTKVFENDYSYEEIKKWLEVFIKRFFTQQFKRDCVPNGPKIGTIGLSPRGDLVIPSDADKTIWMENI